MTVRALEVWWDGRVVGQLTQNQHGELGFAYSPGWLQNNDASPLSASLPKRVEPFSRRECRPFFGGLRLYFSVSDGIFVFLRRSASSSIGAGGQSKNDDGWR
jgi:hypothetical protein